MVCNLWLMTVLLMFEDSLSAEKSFLMKSDKSIKKPFKNFISRALEIKKVDELPWKSIN